MVISGMSSTVNPELLDPQWFKDQHGVEHFLAKTNDNFEKYYHDQKICDDNDEWNECLAAMRRPLPQSFRINSARLKTAPQLIKLLKDFAGWYRHHPVDLVMWSHLGFSRFLQD